MCCLQILQCKIFYAFLHFQCQTKMLVSTEVLDVEGASAGMQGTKVL